MKRFVLPVIILFISLNLHAQGYSVGQVMLGPSAQIGFWKGKPGIGLALSGEYAKGLFFDNISIGGDFGITTYKKRYFAAQWMGITWFEYRYTGLYLAPLLSWHILPDNVLDPYARLGFGTYLWFYKYTDNLGNTSEIKGVEASHKPVEVKPHIVFGARYWFADNKAIRIETGYPMVFVVGLDFNVK